MLVQVTLVPTFTVSVAGLKAKLATEMLFPLLVETVVGVSVGAVVGVGVGAVVATVVDVGAWLAALVPPPQAVSTTRKLMASRHNQMRGRIIGRRYSILISLLTGMVL